MGKRFNGLKEAIDMLSRLDLGSQERLIADIARQDPEMAMKLKEKLVTFEDLQFITPKMLPLFLQKINLDELGLALRGAKKEISDHILKNVSSGMKKDIEDILKGKPRSLSEVLEAQQNIMKVVIQMRDKGELILDKSGHDKLV
jgi:flagellar motor switch protein FliG